jgi:hypothetical protein
MTNMVKLALQSAEREAGATTRPWHCSCASISHAPEGTRQHCERHGYLYRDGAFAFTVHATNVHEALVEALATLVALRDRPHGFADPSWYEAGFDRARAALAPATGH